MKLVILILGALLSAESMASVVFCGQYYGPNVSGFSLYRTYDRVDLGNAVWTGNSNECEYAAALANWKNTDLVCGRYHNDKLNQTSYSVYRISDNRDLGAATIGDFQNCQNAVSYARNGVFCSTYIKDNQTWWSMYSIATGEDLGTQIYRTLEDCVRQY